jgi:hypothetical protein
MQPPTRITVALEGPAHLDLRHGKVAIEPP